MVTATNGTLSFRNAKDGSTQQINFYIADVIGTDVKLNLVGIAAATNQAFTNSKGDVILEDVSIKTGPTVMTALVVKRDDVPTGTVLAIADHLNTLAFRPKLAIPYRNGTKITFTEV